MKESPSNVGIVCKDHAPKPNAKFAKEKPLSFVGKYVKIGFRAKLPTGNETVEHMWVAVKAVEGKKLQGILNNDPVLAIDVECGDSVTFDVSEIEAVY